MNRQTCVRLLTLCIFLILGIASAAYASPMCPPLPPTPAGWRQEDFLATIIYADIHNIIHDEPNRPKYITRLVANMKDTLDLDCTTENGFPRLDSILQGMEKAFKSEANWEKSREGVELFKKNADYAAMAVILEAQYWASYAWNARGNGFASTVTPDGWKLFHERMERAEKLLIENKVMASTIPSWYTLMIEVQSSLGRSKSERMKVFVEGATRFKKNYRIYATMRTFLEPKWGGSYEVVDDFIEWSARNTKDVMGDMIYARLYSGLRNNLLDEQNFFKDTKVNWPRFKKAYFEVMEAYPNSKSRWNEFASVACEAGDKETFHSLRRKIGKDVVRQARANKYSLELCDAKFGYDQ